MASFVALGVHGDLDAAKAAMIRKESVFAPDAANAARYQRIYNEVYLKAYDRYKPLYQSLKQLK